MNRKRNHLGGGRGGRQKKKKVKRGSFFSEIMEALTDHRTLTSNTKKNNAYNERQYCLKNLNKCEIPACPTVPARFNGISQYYNHHLQFTLHEARYLVKEKTKAALLKHGISFDGNNNNYNNDDGDNNKYNNNFKKEHPHENYRRPNNNNKKNNKAKMFRCNNMLQGEYVPSNNINNNCTTFGNNTRDHRKQVPSKIELVFKIVSPRNHRRFKDVARAQCVVLIYCQNKIFLAACSGDERHGSHLTFESCECAYYFFANRNFDPRCNVVYFQPITSVLNLKRMNDVCRYSPSLGQYTRNILGWKNGVHTTFSDSSDDDVVCIEKDSDIQRSNNGNSDNSVINTLDLNNNTNNNVVDLTALDTDDTNQLKVNKLFLTLNKSQNTAINIVLDPDNSLVLLQGPPGTGKTYTISVLLEELYKSGLRVAICASTNKAVHVAMEKFVGRFQTYERSKLNISLIGVDDDNIPEKLGPYFVHNAARKFIGHYINLRKLTDQLEDFGLKEEINEAELLQKVEEISNEAYIFFNIGLQLVKLDNQIRVFQSVLRKLKTNLDDNNNTNPMRSHKLRTLPQDLHILMCSMEETVNDVTRDQRNIENVVLHSTQFLFLTLACCGRHSIRKTRKVDILICDEASQALEVETLIAMSLNPTKVILVGDPMQLSAMVQSQDAIRKHFDRSLMSRLMNMKHSKYHMLDEQYRMHPTISKWPSKQYYNNLLRNAASVIDKKMDWKYPDGYQPITFFNCNQGIEERDHLGSHRNEIEAKRVVDIILKVNQNTNSNVRVKVITYYAAQVRLIRDKLKEAGYQHAMAKNLVITVDAFQGSEADVVILSFVRTQKSVGFLSDSRRLNVSLTRAKDLLVLVGNHDKLKDCNSEDIRSLMEHVAVSDAFYIEEKERERRRLEKKRIELFEEQKKKRLVEEVARDERIRLMNEQQTCNM